jgi:tetratricopeptide (TPR) repeat protein
MKLGHLTPRSSRPLSDQDASFSKYNWYHLGSSYLNLGGFKEAARYFEKYLKFDRNNFEIISLIGLCYATNKKHEAALASYERASALVPNTLEIYIERSNLLAKLNRKEEALELLKKTELKFEGALEKEIIKAISYKISGDLKEAIQVLREVITKIEDDKKYRDPFRFEDTSILLAESLRESGDSKGALLVLESALERNQNDLWLINSIAMEYADQNINLEKGIQLINRALKYQPANHIFLDTKGWLLFKSGHAEQAIDIINKSLALNPNCEETKEHFKAILNSQEHLKT